jgi:uncharacterized membrane protein
MIFLVALVLATLISAALPARFGARSSRRAARLGMAAAMVFAGAAHWFMPEPFVQHLPSWVPAPETLVLVSGGIEIALGGALLTRQPWRRVAGLAPAAYLVAVFPANVYVAASGVQIEGLPGASHPWLRLPFQFVYIAWTFWAVPGSWQLARTRARQLRDEAAPLLLRSGRADLPAAG